MLQSYRFNVCVLLIHLYAHAVCINPLLVTPHDVNSQVNNCEKVSMHIWGLNEPVAVCGHMVQFKAFRT